MNDTAHLENIEPHAPVERRERRAPRAMHPLGYNERTELLFYALVDKTIRVRRVSAKL